MGLLSEAITSIALACTLAVVVPGLFALLAAGRNAPSVTAGYIGGVALISWVRFGGWIPGPDSIIADVFVAVLLLAAVGAFRVGRRVAVCGGAMFGGLISLYWRPCVGLEFAGILNDIPDRPLVSFAPFVLYVVVLLTPVVVGAALPVALPRLQQGRDNVVVAGVGRVACAVVALAIGVGWFEDLMGELYRLSA